MENSLATTPRDLKANESQMVKSFAGDQSMVSLNDRDRSNILEGGSELGGFRSL